MRGLPAIEGKIRSTRIAADRHSGPLRMNRNRGSDKLRLPERLSDSRIGGLPIDESCAMRIRFWLTRYLIAFTFAFLLLLGVELLKGHGVNAGSEFALFWGALSAAVFVGTRIYYVSLGKNCPMCNDLPARLPRPADDQNRSASGPPG
jgi:hypothetical protein